MSQTRGQTDGRRTSRRRFTQTLAAAALGSSGLAAADEAEKDPQEMAAQALANLARTRFGKHLTIEQQKHVQHAAARQVRTAERLRRVRLSNGDQPAFTFHADLP
jgi:hypothetical protein